MRRPTRTLVFLAAVLVASTLSCGREITGPGAVRMSGPLSFAAEFPTALRAASGGLSNVVALEKVRVLFRRSDGGIAFDKTFDFPSNRDSLPPTLLVPIASGTSDAGESLALSMFYVDAANDTVFTGGPVSVTVRPSKPGDPAPAPIPVTLRLTAPGKEAVRVVRSPEFTLANATLTVASGTISTHNGTVAGGARTIAAQLDNQGTMTVGPGTAGRLTVTGSPTNSGTNNLELHGTTAATQFDQIVIGGTPSSSSPPAPAFGAVPSPRRTCRAGSPRHRRRRAPA